MWFASVIVIAIIGLVGICFLLSLNPGLTVAIVIIGYGIFGLISRCFEDREIKYVGDIRWLVNYAYLL